MKMKVSSINERFEVRTATAAVRVMLRKNPFSAIGRSLLLEKKMYL